MARAIRVERPHRDLDDPDRGPADRRDARMADPCAGRWDQLPRRAAMSRARSIALCLMLGACTLAEPAAPRTLEVGPGKPYRLPSQAVTAASDGDRIVIAPGTYADCAVVRQKNLVIEGSDRDGGAVLAGKTCMGKAILSPSERTSRCAT